MLFGSALLIQAACIVIANAVQLPLTYVQSETAILGQQQPATPLCLISSWEAGDLPLYAQSMFQSLEPSQGFVKLFIFYYKTKKIPTNTYAKSFIEYVNIEEIENGKYSDSGFSQFLADRLIEIYGVQHDTFKSNMLQSAIEFLQYRPKSAPAMLRGMYGRIFEHWIHHNVCDSWAWTDLDVLYGDLRGWLHNNPIVWDMDVYTIAGSDWGSLYTRGQFTAHILKNYPQVVNNIWRFCEQFKNIETLSKALVYSGLCIDEGCYGRAVFKSKLRFGVFPWQGNDWDNRKSDLVIHDGIRLWTAKHCDDILSCTELIHGNKHSQYYRRNSISGKVLTDGVKTASSEDVEIIQRRLTTSVEGCLWWIAPTYKTCVESKGVGLLNGYDWMLFAYDGYVDMISWKVRLELPQPTKVIEYLTFHFAHWKGLIQFPTIGVLSLDSNVTDKAIELSKHNLRFINKREI